MASMAMIASLVIASLVMAMTIIFKVCITIQFESRQVFQAARSHVQGSLDAPLPSTGHHHWAVITRPPPLTHHRPATTTESSQKPSAGHRRQAITTCPLPTINQLSCENASMLDDSA